jgi:hypothetical protein
MKAAEIHAVLADLRHAIRATLVTPATLADRKDRQGHSHGDKSTQKNKAFSFLKALPVFCDC